MGRTSVKVRETKSHRNFSRRTHPIHPTGPKTDVLEHFLLFGFIRDRLLALRNSVQNGPDYCKKFVPRSRVGFFRNEATRSTPCDPKLTFCCVHTIWVHSGLFGCLTKLDAKRAEQVQNSCHEVASEFFTTKAPDPPHWTLN